MSDEPNATMFFNFMQEHGVAGVLLLITILNQKPHAGRIKRAAKQFEKKASWMSLFVEKCFPPIHALHPDLLDLLVSREQAKQEQIEEYRKELEDRGHRLAVITYIARSGDQKIAPPTQKRIP